MIIKKYKAQSEEAAITLAKEDLGKDAIVMNVKTIKGKGIVGLFKKTIVEVTAAVDDNVITKEKTEKEEVFNLSYHNGNSYNDNKPNAIEEKINSIAKLLEMQVQASKTESSNVTSNSNNISNEKINDSVYNKNDEIKYDKESKSTSSIIDKTNSTSDNTIISLILHQLIENEVTEEYANNIINELDIKSADKSIDNALASVYQKIVLKLGQIEVLKDGENKPKVVFFVGNTGVGKTTTMAKLASKYLLDYKKKIAMVSVDTYRIAAIEQLKTYANILHAPMEVAYTQEDVKNIVNKYNDYDYVFVDTAGRSHNNDDQTKELQLILDSVGEFEKEVFLVVSATTKYKDLLRIAKAYKEITNYKIIFTKLDETRGLGNILNIKLDTNSPLSYVTWGQNVPEDLGEVNPQVIAKKLLGGCN